MYYNNTSHSPILSSGKFNVASKSRATMMGKIFVAILLVVVFEGSVRKWVSVSFTNPLVLLRDAMALFGIFFAVKNNFLKFTQFGTQILWFWTAILLLWGMLQVIINQSSPLIFIIGMRFWLLYLWFAYAAAISMTEQDFDFIIKIILLLLLMMAPLTVMQHFLPPFSFLNKQVGGDEGEVFMVSADIVRTTGTFSFTAGNTTFLAFAAPFALAMLASNKKLWKFKWMSQIFILALGITTMVSGSRTAFVTLILLFSIYLVISLVYSKNKKRGSTIVMIIAMTSMLALIPFVFSRALNATQERVESASQQENLNDRIFSLLFGEPGVYENLSLVGHGFGSGTNFAGVVATGKRTFLLAETEMARTILEGGMIGFLFVFLKLFIIFIGLKKSLIIAKKTGNSLPFMLWITVGLALLSWSIILQLTINTLGFLLLGMAIASLCLFSKKQ
jgi:hypothetical protein